jgi:hypothetical protein
MNGFLGHLAARSVGTAEQLTPRPWSRFEPAAGPVETLHVPLDDSGPGEDGGQQDRQDPIRSRLPTVPAATDERAGESPPRGPALVVEPGPPADVPTAAPGPPVQQAPPAPPPLPAEASPVGQPARRRGTASTIAPPTRPGQVPVPPGEPEHGNRDAPSERPAPSRRRPEDPSRAIGTTAPADPTPTPGGSTQSSPVPPEAEAVTPLRAPARWQPARSWDVGSARPATESPVAGSGRGHLGRSTQHSWEDSHPAEDDVPAAVAPRATAPSLQTRHPLDEATPGAVPVPAPAALRSAVGPGDTDSRTVAGHQRTHPRPGEFPLLGLLRPPVSPDVPVRAPERRALDPGPTIEVTIGRVEVRAAPPTPPARRPSGPRPGVLPLAEYLAHRTGGR